MQIGFENRASLACRAPVPRVEALTPARDSEEERSTEARHAAAVPQPPSARCTRFSEMFSCSMTPELVRCSKW